MIRRYESTRWRVTASPPTRALKISNRVYVMGHGRIVFCGKPSDFGADSAVRKEWLEV
jgi:branched-chain amino acid transport system ATP-binding protein